VGITGRYKPSDHSEVFNCYIDVDLGYPDGEVAIKGSAVR